MCLQGEQLKLKLKKKREKQEELGDEEEEGFDAAEGEGEGGEGGHGEGAHGEVKAEQLERSVHSVAAELVKPLRQISGRFEITTTSLYFIPDAPADAAAAGGAGGAGKTNNAKLHKERKWALRHVNTVYPRRHLLRQCAIELFLHDRTNYFLNFKQPKLLKEVLKKLAGLRLRNLVIVTPKMRKTLLKDTTARWRERRMSNFEYIMAVNTISGPSFSPKLLLSRPALRSAHS